MTIKDKPKSLPSRRSRDWKVFETSLTDALSRLGEDQFLIISEKKSARFIQFAGQGSFGLRSETTSNVYLSGKQRLSESQIVKLRSLGWFPPTGSPQESTPRDDPDGSPNYFVDHPNPVSFTSVSHLVVQTLIEVWEIGHPGWLEYEAFTTEGDRFALNSLGLKWKEAREKHTKSANGSARVLDALRNLIGDQELEFDEDGDVVIQRGFVPVMIQVLKSPERIRIYGPLVMELQDCAEVLSKLNELNSGITMMRFFHRFEAVYAVIDLPIICADLDQLRPVINTYFEVAEEVSLGLQSDFGGVSPFAPSMISHLKH